MLKLSEHWPQLLISKAITNLAGCKYFTLLDLKDAFNKIPLHPDSTSKTAFTFPSGKYAGTYEWKYHPLGLKNSGNTFQRFIDGVLHDLQPMVVMAFCDDLLLYSATLEENINRLRSVFEKLQAANLTLNLEKCQIAVKEVAYMEISNHHRISRVRHRCSQVK
jgi:hypothetical protein